MRRLGLRVTPQRFAILEYLARHRDHPTADAIFRAINRRFPRASRATVYNTVEALQAAGLISAIGFDDGVKRYDANLDAHHHFICRRCRKILDIHHSAVRGRFKLDSSYKVEAYEVILRGLCAACS